MHNVLKEEFGMDVEQKQGRASWNHHSQVSVLSEHACKVTNIGLPNMPRFFGDNEGWQLRNWRRRSSMEKLSNDILMQNRTLPVWYEGGFNQEILCMCYVHAVRETRNCVSSQCMSRMTNVGKMSIQRERCDHEANTWSMRFMRRGVISRDNFMRNLVSRWLHCVTRYSGRCLPTVRWSVSLSRSLGENRPISWGISSTPSPTVHSCPWIHSNTSFWITPDADSSHIFCSSNYPLATGHLSK